MMTKRLITCLVLVLISAVAMFLTGCGMGPTVSFNNGARVSTLKVEVAKTPAERQRGLMNRESLPAGRGMLFDFGRNVETAFWMKDTSIPLSIAFIDTDRKVLSVKDMVPYDLAAVEPPGEYRYAVETNRGWFGEHGIGPGDRAMITP
jgi:uncharacterized membrane protein (UPF0127 family)